MSQIENEKNEENASKVKIIIISKKGKLDKSSEGRIITVKNEEGRMELRMDNISENISKAKIDKTLLSLFRSRNFTCINNSKKKIVFKANKSSLSSERVNYISNDNIYTCKNISKIEEKIKKKIDIKSNREIIDRLEIYDKYNIIPENNNKIVNNNETFEQEGTKLKEEKSRDLIKKGHIIDLKDEEEEESNELDEGIYNITSKNKILGSSKKDCESDKALNNPQSEIENKLQISSSVHNFNNLINTLKSNLNSIDEKSKITESKKIKTN